MKKVDFFSALLSQKCKWVLGPDLNAGYFQAMQKEKITINFDNNITDVVCHDLLYLYLICIQRSDVRTALWKAQYEHTALSKKRVLSK